MIDRIPTAAAPPARPESAEEYRPTAPPEAGPTPEDEAESLGHWLGKASIAAGPPAEWTPAGRAAFVRGFVRGYREFEAEVAHGEPRPHGAHESEVIRAVGVVESRAPATP